MSAEENKNIYFSYIQTEPDDVKTGYTNIWITNNGVGILGKGNFDVNIDRNIVRDIFKKGKIVLVVKTELLNFKNPSIFLTDVAYVSNNPTVISIKNMLPVRLLSIELYNSKGVQILKRQGAEINIFDPN